LIANNICFIEKAHAEFIKCVSFA
jgi:hypothetical protein